MKIVPKEELIELIEALCKLAALENGGVDNWEWCGESISDFLDRYWIENHDALIKFFNLTTEEEIEEFKGDFSFSDIAQFEVDINYDEMER